MGWLVSVNCNTGSCRSQHNAAKRNDFQAVFSIFLLSLAIFILLECALRTCILVVDEHAEKLFRVGIPIE